MVCPAYDDPDIKTFVLDTKTGQLWRRDMHRSIDFGTCQNPIFEVVKRKNRWQQAPIVEQKIQ